MCNNLLPFKWSAIINNKEPELLNKIFKKIKNKQNLCPNKENIFKAYNIVEPENVKVVIIGQDPYHTKGVANGFAFAVNPGEKFPPSLKNIFKELKNDLNIDPPLFGDLSNWAKQGVFCINSIMTCEEGSPGCHKDIGWEEFTKIIISHLQSLNHNIVFILWGNYAKKFENLISGENLIIKSPHPSPLSANRGFYGSKPFSKTNEYLIQKRKKPIDW